MSQPTTLFKIIVATTQVETALETLNRLKESGLPSDRLNDDLGRALVNLELAHSELLRMEKAEMRSATLEAK